MNRRSHAAVAGVLGLTISVLSACEPAPPSGTRCTITGTDAADVIYGTSGDDVICALGGDDFIFGLAGNDEIGAGAGNDIINPGEGNDRVFGEAGNDQVDYWRDVVPGGSPKDERFPIDGSGNDTVYMGDGTDTAYLGDGDDVAYTGPNPRLTESLRGEAGHDRLYAPEGTMAALVGGSGNDYLEHQGTGNMNGEDGDDILNSFTPGNPLSTTGGLGSDLAFLMDGSLDYFTMSDSADAPLPILPFIPCTFAVGDNSFEGSCELPGGFEFGAGFSEQGDVTFSGGYPGITAELVSLANSGLVTADVCVCDPGGSFPGSGDIVY